MTERKEERQHQLSPSAWNRYETCPRMYWLSRQGFPRKAGMAASLGTAVHASIEDLLNMDISHQEDMEMGWFPDCALQMLQQRWDEEKAVFLSTPRRPMWKEEQFTEAKRQQRGGVIMLLDHIGVKGLAPERISYGLWKKLQQHVIAVEGELKTRDGRLMGRLDLLLADVDMDGNMTGWLVADLKTGHAPETKLKEEVNRQLRMYRDILLVNNPNAPTVRTEGWYTKTASKWPASGPSVLEEAYAAWEATQISDQPLPAITGDETCGGFCDFKAWCPHWWNWRQDSGTLHTGDFMDMVVLIHTYDESSGAAIVELCEPSSTEGHPLPTGHRLTANFEQRGKEAFEEVWASHKGATFIASAMMRNNSIRVGHWCDILPWNPISDQGQALM